MATIKEKIASVSKGVDNSDNATILEKVWQILKNFTWTY